MTVYRYGAVNVRAALRYVRDVAVGATMDATDPRGLPSRSPDGAVQRQLGGRRRRAVSTTTTCSTTCAGCTRPLLPDSALGLDNGAGATLQRGALVIGADHAGLGRRAVWRRRTATT